MALGRRKAERQEDLFITADALPRSPGHVFYQKLNEVLLEAGFDAWIEKLCEPYYAQGQGRPSIPPGTYFRMLLVGYFEGLGSQRGIAWRCSDSLSLREFLGVPLKEDSPDHSSLSVIRKRLPREVHDQFFLWVLKLAEEKKLLKGKSVGVDSTTLEADAAMKSIVRRESGEDWREYVTRLMREEGVIGPDEQPTLDEVRRFDKAREDKKVSNEEWKSPADPDARIARMKDGTTHLAYKAEHVVDLESDLILAAEVYHADQADPHTLEDSLHQAQANLSEVGSTTQIKEAAADCGYHGTETLTDIHQHTEIRTYIPEPKRKHDRNWKNKPPAQKAAVDANRRRTKGNRGRELQRERSEKVERTFAHVCETGGARRSWLVGIDNVRKRYSVAAAAHNLGCLLRKLFGMGTPRGLQAFVDLAASAYLLILTVLCHLRALLAALERATTNHRPRLRLVAV